MSRGRLQYSLIASWFMALLVIFALRIVSGSTVASTPGLGMLLLACIPPAVLLVVFKGAPDADAARELYETGHASEQPIPVTAQGPGAVRSTMTSGR